MNRERWRPALRVLAGVLLAGVAVAAAPVLLFSAIAAPGAVAHVWNCLGHGSFDARVWRDPALAGDVRDVRGCMVDDLLDDDVLVGRTRAEVVARLGEPPATSYFRDWDLVYRVGMERGFISIDSEWLVLRLGADGRVARATLVTD